jgi:hypothetical protein
MFVCGGLSYERPLYRYVPDFVWIETLQATNPPTISPYYNVAPLLPAQPMPAPAAGPSDPSQPPPLATAQPMAPTPAPPAFYQAAPPVPAGITLREALSDTLAAAWTIALAAIAGFIAAYIFTQQRNSAPESR